jgi:hypothetical protein
MYQFAYTMIDFFGTIHMLFELFEQIYALTYILLLISHRWCYKQNTWSIPCSRTCSFFFCRYIVCFLTTLLLIRFFLTFLFPSGWSWPSLLYLYIGRFLWTNRVALFMKCCRWKHQWFFKTFQRSFFVNNFNIFIVVDIASTTFITICQLMFDFCFWRLEGLVMKMNNLLLVCWYKFLSVE